MSGNSSCWNSCLEVVGVGFLFILWPIIILCTSFTSEQTYIRQACGIWLAVLFLIFSTIKNNGTKFAMGAMACFVYATIFGSWYSEYVLKGEYNDGRGGDWLFMFLGVFTMLAPMWFVGAVIIDERESKKRKKREQQLIQLNQRFLHCLQLYQKKRVQQAIQLNEKINVCGTEISEMEKVITNRKHVLKAVKLLETCGACISEISNNAEFKAIETMYQDIEKKKYNLTEMQNKLKSM